MEKLIELLNEYRTEKLRREMYVNGAGKEAIELSEAERINEYEVSQTLDSQNYLKSFVKWLVENERVDKDKIKENGGYVKMSRLIWNGSKDDVKKYWEYRILMLLSISNSPIEDLLLYLK